MAVFSMSCEWLVSAHSKGLAEVNSPQLTVDSRTTKKRLRTRLWRIRSTKVDDTGSERGGVKALLEELVGRVYIHPPAFRIVFKTRGLLNLTVVSD